MSTLRAQAGLALGELRSPRVRVIIPVYNGAAFIASAIESVKAQSFTDWELTIVDDGSTDDTVPIVSKYCSSRIVLVRQTRQGDEAARVRAMAGAQTDYLARLDADDMMVPDRLAKQVAFMDENGEVGLLGGQIMYVSEDGTKKGFRSWWPCGHEEIVGLLLKRKGCICNPTLMVRREISDKLTWPLPGVPGKDSGYVLELSNLCAIANLKDVVIYMRIHKNSIQSGWNPAKIHTELYYIRRYCSQKSGLPPPRWNEFELSCKNQPWHKTFVLWYRFKVGSCFRRGMWTWLNRSPKFLSWPWFVLAGIMSPQRVMARLTRRLKAMFR